MCFSKVITVVLLMFTLSGIAEAKSILIIGDSHSCGTFGSTLHSEFALANNKVDLYCTSSSSASNWLKGQNPSRQKCHHLASDQTSGLCNKDGQTPTAESLLTARHYDIVLVALGTNSLWMDHVSNDYRDLAHLIRAYSDSCIWVSPPHLIPNQASGGFTESDLGAKEAHTDSFFSSLKTKVGPYCSMADSRKYTVANSEGGKTRDGVHRTPESAAYWAYSILANFFEL